MPEEIVEDGRLLLKKLGPLGPVANNLYVLADSETRDAVVIDAPEGCEVVESAVKGLNVQGIIVTHRHRDHWAGIETLLSKVSAPVFTHEADREPWEQYVNGNLAEGDEVEVGGLRLRILHTPGHTPGGICIQVGDQLISGDTLFPGGPGRTRDNEALQTVIESITSKLYVLPEDVSVYPGHGANTTIGESKAEYEVFASKPHDPELSGDVLWLSS